jgi:CheY-like chemotaxis protein
MAGQKILVIDSNDGTRTAVSAQLAAQGYDTIQASSGTQAIRSMMDTGAPAVVIVDENLVEEDPFSSAWDAFGIMNWIKRMLPNAKIPMIIHAASRSPDLVSRAQEKGIFAVVEKDGLFAELVSIVQGALPH